MQQPFTQSLVRHAKTIFVAALFFLSAAQHASALTITPIKLELHGNPGQTIKQEVTLYNELDVQETLYVSYANFEASGENGNPNFSDAHDDLGTWMQAADKISLAPKSSQIIPLTINVPKDAAPGGHFAAVFWGTVPPGNSGNQVSIGAKTGLLVLLSVNGDVSENGGIIEYGIKSKQSLYTSLPITFFYRFQNNGADRVKPTGSILMKNMIGFTSATVPGNPVDGNVLPHSTRRIETAWQGSDGSNPVSDRDQGNFFNKAGYEWRNFAFGHYKANLTLAYGLKNQVTTASVGFWVFPWHLLVLVVVVIILLYLILKKLIRNYNAWVIKKAEQMLKREQSKTRTKV